MFNPNLTGFTPFSLQHLIAVLVLIGVAVVLYVQRRNINATLDRRIRITAVVLMLGLEWTFYAWSIRTVGFDATLLPFGLCAMSLYLTCILLITKSRRVFTIVFPWAITGALMSYVVADMPYRFPHFRYIHYFGNHGLFLLGVLYMMWVYRFRLTYRDVLHSSAILTIWAAIMYPMNAVLNANHLFLRELPGEVAPMFAMFGAAWPFVFSFGIFLVFNLIYVMLRIIPQRPPEPLHQTS